MTVVKLKKPQFRFVKDLMQCSHHKMNQVIKPRGIRFGLGSVLVVTVIVPVGSKVQSFNTDLQLIKVELDAGLQM